MPATHENDEEMHTQMFQLVELQPATEYEAVIKARNKFGWSEQSEALVFKTKSEGLYATLIVLNSTGIILCIEWLFCNHVFGVFMRIM